ncbi:3-hydroxyacyl-CoA dehydrogenase NAD-binding domain-containing protein [Rhodohalobacter sulfatireducens]|uniref:enoyl-CoA hydratase n=1 Tax=Rhodohalobacter sulfatireducens TaxID=2911366 RepID=A0ABS9KFH6_9BACT|nr:3-hydroxyacyl-CoA dehydrogenase NAD-binding domain-containing protein [Rhodohalobacter sulfatireducens]MCG2589607.1 3-hydroxyacyl-CoA dehydrogenase NAD-binding domain-containing protein [Rhodohalobacter sulfatireducens]
MNKKKKILQTETVENVAIITLDTPGEKVNKLNEQLIDEFSDLLDKLGSDDTLEGALLISGKENNFIAGADIEMFKTRETAEELSELSWTGHEILLRVENFDKPIVVGIHGSCMGGGTELALASHYRIVSDHKSTKIGLPEVKLGLLPGMGGTQRLPRLIGIQKALPYLLTGKNMYSYQAGKTGFADEVVHQYAVKEAGIKAVKKLKNEKVSHPDKRSALEKVSESNALGRNIIFSQARKRTQSETKGNYPAPPKIIDSVEYGYKHGFEKGLENESRLFGELAVTPESRALVQLFFAMNASKKNPLEKKREIKKIGVLGAGLMGSGITEVSIEDEFHVWLKDQKLENAMKGESSIRENLDKKVGKHIISEFERDETMSSVHPTETYDGFEDIDLVIEAVFEDLDLKRNIVKEIEDVCPDNTIFASNTSSLPISDIAKNAKRPENIVGMHYFSPVQKMPLLEIVKTDQTADWVVATAFDVGLRQGKNVIVVNDGPGFYTTRILAPYINEALLLLEEGAKIEDLDSAMKQFGFPVGPVALLDEVGIDVGAHVADTLSDKFEARGAKTSKKSKELMDEDYLGRKNKRGFYKYEKGSKKKKEVNEKIYKYFGGTDRLSFDQREIQYRLSTMMINEAVLCLQEEILKNPTDGDLGAILGLGFPPFLGGPFRYIDRIGLESFLESMNTLHSSNGDRFKPADLLLEMKSSQSLFHPKE